MAQYNRFQTDEQRKRLARNRKVMLKALSHQRDDRKPSTQSAGMTIIVERFAVRGADRAAIPYEGPCSLARILEQLASTYPEGRVEADGRLLGVQGLLGIEGQDRPVALRATLGAGGQVRLAVGPVREMGQALDAMRVFDRQFHLASKAVGIDSELTSQGCHPSVRDASELAVVPTAANALVNAHLARRGPAALAFLRCSAATTLRLPIAGDERASTRQYRLCAALAPLVGFLTDNSLRLPGRDPHDTPRMARTGLAHASDSERSGLVPGTFSDGFGYAAYERWVEGICPIVFASQDGVTFSTGTDTCEQVMAERELTASEARHMLSMAWPDVRWDGSLELSCADALPPRLACGYAALVKGLMETTDAQGQAAELLGLGGLDDDAIADAWQNLAAHGWDARIYGKDAGALADELVALARAALDDPGEHHLLDELAQLWEVRMVPRDTLLANWDRSHPRTTRLEAAELYGEGAVIPYDELDGDPPAGQTAVIDLRQIQEALAQTEADPS